MLGKLAIVCWCIWSARNKFLIESPRIDPGLVSEWALSLVADSGLSMDLD